MGGVIFIYGLVGLLLFRPIGIAFIKESARHLSRFGLLPLLAVPLGLLWIAPFTYLNLGFFFPGISDAIYLLSHLYFPDWSKRHAVFVLITLISAPVTAWFGIALLYRSHKANFRLHIFLMLGLLSTGILGSIWFGHDFSQASRIIAIARAEAIAGSEAYCIQTPATRAFRPAIEISNSDELSAWALGGRRMFSFIREVRFGNHHAVLAVGERKHARLFYWSHRAQNFLGPIKTQIPVFCTARPHFAKTFTHVPIHETNNLEFAVAGFAFSIPKKFRPFLSGYDGAPSFLFYASTPSFIPVPVGHNTRDVYLPAIEVTLRPQSLAVNIENPGYRIATTHNKEFGLRKGTRTHLDRNGTAHSTKTIYYLVSDTGDDVSTFIECHSITDGFCMHSFVMDGWTYRFQHSPRYLSSWPVMQKNLVKLSRSFVIENAEH